MIHDPKAVTGPFGGVYLGRSGQKASRVCMGTMTFGSQVSDTEAFRMLDATLDRGVFFFDTANAYNGGQSETILGKWIRDKRDRVVVSTKVRYQVGTNDLSVGLSRRTIVREVENSLARLNTDCIDLLYLHQPDDHADPDETLAACDDLIRTGKVHLLGLSNFAAWQVAQFVERASSMMRSRPWVYQLMYNMLVRNAESELLPCCRNYHLSVFAYNPLAAGILTGKHDLRSPKNDGRFAVLPYYADRYWHEPFFNAVDRLKQIAREAGCPLVSLAFRWLLNRPDITGVVIGASSFEQLQYNFAQMEGGLTADVMAEIDAVWKSLNSPIPSYHR